LNPGAFFCVISFIKNLQQKSYCMNELVEQLTSKVGLSPEQAQKAIETIAGFVKDKFPMLGGAVDQIFKSDTPGADGKAEDGGLGSMMGGLGGFGK
jgi:hypothetical protein